MQDEAVGLEEQEIKGREEDQVVEAKKRKNVVTGVVTGVETGFEVGLGKD
ncbi:MAG: hypothetical protein ACRC4N_08625 [Gammaproteobacteria bacterium]